MYNEIIELKDYIPIDSDENEIVDKVYNMIHCDLYSYFIGRKNDDIIIKVCYAVNVEYNTIDSDNAKCDIVNAIIDYLVTLSDVKCIAFGQPPLELILTLYEPMLAKMAHKIHQQWPRYDVEDLLSIANFIVVKCYKLGYYINKSLIWTSLNNEILLENRKVRYEPNVVSLEDKMKKTFKVDSEELTYGDTVEDPTYKAEEEQKDEQQLDQYVFEQVKQLIIEKIGERQWDRLWRDYSKSHTTNCTRQTMKRMKSYFEELGLTRQDFINHYRR